MKKGFSGVGVVAALVVGSGVVLASSAGPLVSPVSAQFAVNPTQQVQIATCTGANGHSYLQESDVWQGGQQDTSTTTAPYGLTGVLTVTAKAIVDQTTGAGISKGTITLTNATTNAIIYKGPLTLNIQITNPTTLDAVGRGAMNVPLYTNGAPNGSRLIGNVEVQISGPGAAQPLQIAGQFGGATQGVPDLAAEFNGRYCGNG